MDSVNTIIEQLIVQYSMEKLTNNVYFSEEHKLVLTIDNSTFTQGFSLHHIKVKGDYVWTTKQKKQY